MKRSLKLGHYTVGVLDDYVYIGVVLYGANPFPHDIEWEWRKV